MTIIATLDEVFGDVTMNIYPNPLGDEELTISSSVLSDYKTIRMYDQQSKLMMLEEIKSRNEIQIDLSQFNKGIYFIHLIGENRKSIHKILK